MNWRARVREIEYHGAGHGRAQRPAGGVTMPMRRYAPFPTARWWLLHTLAIAAVYAIGHLLLGR
jgi:hypothetical protein